MKKIKLRLEKLPYDINEEMKSLRTNIQFCGEEKKVILFTSTVSDEGKSNTTFDLAVSFAELGKSVLLIDADLRKSVMAKEHTEEPQIVEKGLSHYLSGQCDLEEVLFQTDVNKLFAVFAVKVPPNPAELLANARMKKLLKWARDQFDYVLIDCAPLDVVVDAAVIAPNCDGVVFIVKGNAIPRRLAQNAIHQLESAECPILGVVLTQVERRTSERRYRKYGYGYGYYGYGHEPEKKTSGKKKTVSKKKQ